MKKRTSEVDEITRHRNGGPADNKDGQEVDVVKWALLVMVAILGWDVISPFIGQ